MVSRMRSMRPRASLLRTLPIFSKADVDGGTEPAGGGGSEQVAAHQEGGQLGEGELEREALFERVVHPPDGPPAIGLRLVVDGESGVLQDAKVAPDRSDGTVEVTRRLIDRDPGGSVEELEQVPLSGELVPARHGTRRFWAAR